MRPVIKYPLFKCIKKKQFYRKPIYTLSLFLNQRCSIQTKSLEEGSVILKPRDRREVNNCRRCSQKAEMLIEGSRQSLE